MPCAQKGFELAESIWPGLWIWNRQNTFYTDRNYLNWMSNLNLSFKLDTNSLPSNNFCQHRKYSAYFKGKFVPLKTIWNGAILFKTLISITLTRAFLQKLFDFRLRHPERKILFAGLLMMSKPHILFGGKQIMIENLHQQFQNNEHFDKIMKSIMSHLEKRLINNELCGCTEFIASCKNLY